MPLSRRHLLAGLGALTVLPARAQDSCELAGATIPAVTGPFPPPDHHPTLGGRANPGVRRAVPGEHDLDLVGTEAGGGPGGQVVLLRGQVVTAGCLPVVGATVHLWQADHAGQYNHENERPTVKASDLDPYFGYWGTATTDAEGRFVARTIVPGAYLAGGTWYRPPHLHWRLAANGLEPFTTQSYFDGDVIEGVERIRELNAADYILNLSGGYEGYAGTTPLEQARARVKEELVARFALVESVPTAELRFRLG